MNLPKGNMRLVCGPKPVNGFHNYGKSATRALKDEKRGQEPNGLPQKNSSLQRGTSVEGGLSLRRTVAVMWDITEHHSDPHFADLA